ncbi:hypothetical protein [Salipiger sp. PrR007]|uniref:hypothetical protein n=1 Tax=Salipiger sp. PrR007 TaxID=2706884 RepID=UPI0013BE2AEE|nr:hypothetical protein [Salipiger sp. PrR007]NDW34612.1 hypothetical protein [Salipiger sp. PrR007]
MNGPDRASFVIAATSLALRKGGMKICEDSIKTLDSALDAYPLSAPGDEIGPAHGRAREVIDARRAGDEAAFGAAKYALELEMSAFWGLRARAYASGASA